MVVGGGGNVRGTKENQKARAVHHHVYQLLHLQSLQPSILTEKG